MVKETSYDGDQIRGDTLNKQLFVVKICSRVLHTTPNVVNEEGQFLLPEGLPFHNSGRVHADCTPNDYIAKECGSVDLHATNCVETAVGKRS
jgi:hypothetical protein